MHSGNESMYLTKINFSAVQKPKEPRGGKMRFRGVIRALVPAFGGSPEGEKSDFDEQD